MDYELLAPAGQPDAGYAALHYGADAVYCGLTEFSARAEAVNFTPAELAVFARYAHSLMPARRVYLTLNTLLRDSELDRAVDTMATALDCGVDALIVQDLGLAKVARDFFPNVELHASTQMALHSLDGVRAAKKIGFHRVTLARELTLEEIADICANGGVEIETFIHGTLCYSYSGLCLFSSIVTGRSGNRGRCVYSCREAADTPAGRAHPFSLKDMALGADVLELARAGVKSFKIEGRKKSPLYVGATVDYYRRLLDGTFAPGEEEEHRARLQTIFARPWTKLFFRSRRNPDAADTEVVGHRGAPLGTVAGLAKTPAGPGIRFRAARAVERHDGLQIDIPGEARPFGFAVDNLYIMGKGKAESVFAAPAGADIAVALPEDGPVLSAGLPIYQSSSQEVKRSYPFARARSETPDPDRPADIRIAVRKTGEGACVVSIAARAALPEWTPANRDGAAEAAVSLEEAVAAFEARDADGAEAAGKKAFSRTGGSRFFLRDWEFDNPDRVFVKPGDWNTLRRETLARLEVAYVEKMNAACGTVHAFLASAEERTPAPAEKPVWSLVVEDPGLVQAFADADWNDVEEVVVGHASPPERIAKLAERIGKDKIRFSLPLIIRADAARRVRNAVDALLAAGWKKWLVPGLGQLELFAGRDADLSADWSLYALNRQAVGHLESLGFSAFSFSPEDDGDNIAHLLRSFPNMGWLTVYGDAPLFISAACAHSHLGLCRGDSGGRCNHAAASFSPETTPKGIRIGMEKSGVMEIIPQSCGSVVIGEKPFSLLHRMDALRAMGAGKFRADLRWRFRTPEETLALWRSIRRNGAPAGTEGNFSRGLA